MTRSAPAGRHRRPIPVTLCLMALLLAAPPVIADDDFTLYELLAPETASFRITYDTTEARTGREVYLNPIRPGSEVRDERVVDRATGEDLAFALITGAQGKDEGVLPDRVDDQAEYLRVTLAAPVPEGGEHRIRIIKTYRDPATYQVAGDRIVWERSLGIRANSVVLPPGYELVGSSTPGMVTTLPDGRVKISFLNDRDDALGVRIVGRRLPGGAR
jgi:hypothetical protein